MSSREFVQDTIASVLCDHGIVARSRDAKDILFSREVDKDISGAVGKIAYRKTEDTTREIRITLKLGKFIRKFFGENLSDFQVQNIGADITAVLWSNNDVKELTGEDIRDFYGSCGVRSCMSGRNAQDYLDIYVDNPEVVALAAIELDGSAARALIWTFPDGRRYMDRMYYGSDACKAALQFYAAEKNLLPRERIPSTEIEVRISDGIDSNWPYIDTMYHVTINSRKSATLSSEYGDYEARETDGRLSETGETCYNCGRRISEDDINCTDDGRPYCESCFSENFGQCESCSGTCPRDYLNTVANGDTVCDDCLSRNYTCCADCEEYHLDVDITSVRLEDEEVCLCSGCMEGYVSCGHCESTVADSGAHIVDENDEETLLCGKCYRALHPELISYPGQTEFSFVEGSANVAQ